MKNKEPLYESRPSLIRGNPIGFAICIAMIFSVFVYDENGIFSLIGTVILLFWYVKALSIKLTLTDNKIIHKQGTLTRVTNELKYLDINNVKIKQGVLQRFFDTGTAMIYTATQGDKVIKVKGVPNPEEIKKIIDRKIQ